MNHLNPSDIEFTGLHSGRGNGALRSINATSQDDSFGSRSEGLMAICHYDKPKLRLPSVEMKISVLINIQQMSTHLFIHPRIHALYFILISF